MSQPLFSPLTSTGCDISCQPSVIHREPSSSFLFCRILALLPHRLFSPSCIYIYLQPSTLSPSLSVVLYTTMQSVLVHRYLILALTSSSSSLFPPSPVPFARFPPSFLLLPVCRFKAYTVLHPLEFSLWLSALGKGFPVEGLEGREKWIKVTQRGAEEFRQKDSRRHRLHPGLEGPKICYCLN